MTEKREIFNKVFSHAVEHYNKYIDDDLDGNVNVDILRSKETKLLRDTLRKICCKLNFKYHIFLNWEIGLGLCCEVSSEVNRFAAMLLIYNHTNSVNGKCIIDNLDFIASVDGVNKETRRDFTIEDCDNIAEFLNSGYFSMK